MIITNINCFILHSCNSEFFFQAAKVTLRKISNLIDAPKVNEMVQSHIVEHGNLQYDHFLSTFLKVIVSRMRFFHDSKICLL